MVTHPPIGFSGRYMLLDLPQDVIRSVACLRLCVHTLRVETATWNATSSPTCDLSDDDDVQDEKHVLFHCTHPQMFVSPANCHQPETQAVGHPCNPQMVSLRKKYMFLFSHTGSQDVSAFSHQKNKKLFFSFMNLIYFMNRRAIILFDWRPFSCKLKVFVPFPRFFYPNF